MDMFNVASVKQAVDSSFDKNKNLEECRDIFLQNIMDWTDNYTENYSQISDTQDAKIALESVGKLWIESALMEIKWKQFKQATIIFDKALTDPLAKACIQTYIEYGKFSTERAKQTKAFKVYMSGLSVGFKNSDSDKIWAALVAMLEATGGKAIGVDEAIREARTLVSKLPEFDWEKIALPSPNFVHPSSSKQPKYSNDSSEVAPPSPTNESAECKETTEAPSHSHHPIHSPSVLPPTAPDVNFSTQTTSTNSSSSIASIPTIEKIQGDGWDDVAGFTPEQLSKTFLKRPPMLFSSVDKVSFANTDSLLHPLIHPYCGRELKDFCIDSVSQLMDIRCKSNEPMASGLSSLDPEIVYRLEQFLDSKLPYRGSSWRVSPKAERYLDLLEALWNAQGFKERHFDSWVRDLKQMQKEERVTMEQSRVDKDRDGKGAEGRARYEAELRRFQARCDVQMEILEAIVNKTMTALLIEQEKILCASGLPYFNPEMIESLVNSNLTVKSISPSESAVVAQLHTQHMVVCGLLSLRLGPAATRLHTPAMNFALLDPSLAPPRGGDMFTFAPHTQDHGNERGGGDISDYYSMEAKATRRKKRRMLASGVISAGSSPHSPHVSKPDMFDPSKRARHTFIDGLGIGGDGGSMGAVALRGPEMFVSSDAMGVERDRDRGSAWTEGTNSGQSMPFQPPVGEGAAGRMHPMALSSTGDNSVEYQQPPHANAFHVPHVSQGDREFFDDPGNVRPFGGSRGPVSHLSEGGGSLPPFGRSQPHALPDHLHHPHAMYQHHQSHDPTMFIPAPAPAAVGPPAGQDLKFNLQKLAAMLEKAKK